MTALRFPVSSSPGISGIESGGRLVNCYAEKLGDERLVWRRAPGLRQIFEVAGYTGCRGFLLVNSTLLVVMGDRLFSVTRSGTVYTITNLGTLPGNSPVTMARNNKTPTPDIVAVTDNTAYLLTTSGAPTSYPDADVGSPNAVTALSGYFVFTYSDAKAQTSGLNDTTISTVDFAFAESKPDGLLRPVPYGNELFLCGSSTIEVWRNTGNPVGFPFSYVDTIPRGVAGQWAIAGFEDGWSNTIIFVGDDSVVYQLQGYQPARISTHALERLIEALDDRSRLRASVYMVEGHAFWSLRAPEWTWVYDLTTGGWHERRSYDSETWRGLQSVRAFDAWLVGDEATGGVFEVRGDTYREGVDPLVARIVSINTGDFPNRVAASRVDLQFAAGTGQANGLDPIQTDPQCSVSWSRDGGATFGAPLLRALEAQGQYTNRVGVNRLGLIQPAGFQVAVECSDPVYFAFLGADLTAGPRTK